MRRLLTPSNVALTLLGVAAVVMLVLVIQKEDASPLPPAAAPSATLPPRPISTVPLEVAFVADGYTSGSPSGGQGPANYTALLAGREGWRVTNVSVYGSGYVAGGTLAAQVPMVVGAGPRLVVVSGGRADSDSDPAAVRNAATRLYDDLRARLPQAMVVVIGPMWLGGDAPRRMTDVRDAIRDAAMAENLLFVDPIADRWFNGSDEDGIAPNGDLNDQGQQRLAELVDDAVQRSGALPQ